MARSWRGLISCLSPLRRNIPPVPVESYQMAACLTIPRRSILLIWVFGQVSIFSLIRTAHPFIESNDVIWQTDPLSSFYICLESRTFRDNLSVIYKSIFCNFFSIWMLFRTCFILFILSILPLVSLLISYWLILLSTWHALLYNLMQCKHQMA